MENIKTFYRRNLPHIQPIGASFFVTFRLHNSIPRIKILELKKQYEQRIDFIQTGKNKNIKDLIHDERKRFFVQYDNLLDSCNNGPTYLNQPEVAEIVKEQLHLFDNDMYELIAYSIMPNHVHILIDTAIQIPPAQDFTTWEAVNFQPLDKIMKRIKGATGRYANLYLKRTGTFWQKESYDHFIRNQKEFSNVIRYILNNPIKARLVNDWGEHPYSFLKNL